MSIDPAVLRVIIAVIVNQLCLSALKACWADIGKSKFLMRATVLAVCLVATLLADWQPDGQISAEWIQTWLAAAAGAEMTYQWLVKRLGGKT